MDRCAAGRKPDECDWRRMHTQDVHGIRQMYWRCVVCNAGRWSTEQAPWPREPTRC